MASIPRSSVDEDAPIPLPRFTDERFEDRGYYLVSEFQDEKRRRDRAAAVKCARKHPRYVCLMTSDNRLLHRNTYVREEIGQFLELYDLISTWATPRFYVMGYPIEPKDLLRGLECYQKMGATCNPLVEVDETTKYSSYFGCPRASISLKYMHPKAWYSVLYGQDPDQAKRYVRLDILEGLDPVEADTDQADDEDDDSQVRRSDIYELRRVSRSYCGCPLIQLQRAQRLYDALPEALEVGDEWCIKPDLMGEPSLQPRSKEVYHELLERLELGTLPCSDRQRSRPDESEDDGDDALDEKVDPAEERRRQLQKYTWLLED